MPFRPGGQRYPDDEVAARFGRDLLEILDARGITGPGDEFTVALPGAPSSEVTAEMIQAGAEALIDGSRDRVTMGSLSSTTEDWAFWAAKTVLEAARK